MRLGGLDLGGIGGGGEDLQLYCLPPAQHGLWVPRECLPLSWPEWPVGLEGVDIFILILERYSVGETKITSLCFLKTQIQIQSHLLCKAF